MNILTLILPRPSAQPRQDRSTNWAQILTTDFYQDQVAEWIWAWEAKFKQIAFHFMYYTSNFHYSKALHLRTISDSNDKRHVGSKSMIQWKWWSCLMSTDNGPVLVFNNVSGWILVTNWGSLCEMYLVNLVYGSRVAFVRRVFCVTWHSVTPGCLWCGGVVKGWWWWLGTSRKKIIIFMPTLMLGMLLGTAKTP